MSGRRLTDKEILKIKRLYQKGTSQRKIAEQMNCDQSTIRHWIRCNFERVVQLKDYNLESKIDIIQQMLNEGHSQEYIAIQCDCPKTTIYKFIHEHNLKKTTTVEKVKLLFNNGCSNKEIAERLNISISSVVTYKTKLNKEKTSKFAARLEDKNKMLIEKNILLQEENEKLKRELEAAYNLDYDTSEIPALKRRIYDLEEMYDQITNTLIVLTASMSSVKYTEYEKQESEDI